MIHSMTGFTRNQSRDALANLYWEIRSVNHRYLEISCRLPEYLSGLEIELREQIKKHIARGKLEISLSFQLIKDKFSYLRIDQDLAKWLIKTSINISKTSAVSIHLNPMDILRWPGVLQTAPVDQAKLKIKLLKSFEEALTDLVAQRAREGKALQKILEKNCYVLQQAAQKIRKKLPYIINEQRQRLIKRFNEAKISLDTTRLEQEIVLFAQKTDVTEELDRLSTHVNEFRYILTQSGAQGRRLDFILQELGREANTLGSKSVTHEMTQAAIEMKVVIEQMREQVQNVE